MAIKDDLFVKLHINAYHDGLMKDLDASSWRLLCALACHIDEQGKCWPSQAKLAEDLGVHEKTVNRWMSDLLSFRRYGRPIVTVDKRRSPKNPEHLYNVYTLEPEACFSMFNDKRRME